MDGSRRTFFCGGGTSGSQFEIEFVVLLEFHHVEGSTDPPAS
jgi:hypothetical protein